MKQLEKNEVLTRKSHETWVSVLAPKAEHSDLSVALCLHLLALKDWSTAIQTAHSMMLVLEDNFYSKLLYNMLTKIQASPIYQKVSAFERVCLLDAVGVFQIRDTRYMEALDTFKAMLAISHRARDGWGISQAYLHQGNAWSRSGDSQRAQRSYQRAAEWARKEGDELQLGRVLSNLAMSQMEDNPDVALQTLEESIQCKERWGDQPGLFAAYNGLGILAAQSGKHSVALKWFRKSERLARRFENTYELGHVLHNQAISLSHKGEMEKAISLSRQARELAALLGCKELEILTVQGEAVLQHRVNNYTVALPLFLKLYTLKKEAGDVQGAIIALSDAGVMELKLEHYDLSRKYLKQATSLSKSTKNRHWLLPCIRNHVEALRKQGHPSQAVNLLRREIRWAEQQDDPILIAEISESLAQLLIALDGSVAVIDKVWENAITALDKCNNIIKQVDLLRQRYAWTRDTQGVGNAISILQSLLGLTIRRKALHRERAEALDEMGTCLQKQGKLLEAESYHRKALTLAQDDVPGTVLATFLNNYAELLRKIEREQEAIPLYKQAISLSKDSSDVEGRLLTEHNLALAYDQVGQTNEALSILSCIREESRKKKLWKHHASAWLELANIAWLQNKKKLALRRYVKVKVLCDEHCLEDITLHAALNHSRLLQGMGKIQEALLLLEPLQEQFYSSEYCLELFVTLGNCHAVANNPKSAIAVYEQGISCSQTRYGIEELSALKIALIEANLNAGQSRVARRQIKQFLGIDLSPDIRAERLIDLLLIVAIDEANKSGGKQSQKLLDEIQLHANINKRPDWVWDAYECFGEAIWDYDREAAAQAT